MQQSGCGIKHPSEIDALVNQSSQCGDFVIILIGAAFDFTPDTTANFNALVTQLEHRFGHGFQASLSYTYSKSLDEVSAEGPGFVTNQTFPTDNSTEYGPSDFDATHYLRAWASGIFRSSAAGTIGWADLRVDGNLTQSSSSIPDSLGLRSRATTACWCWVRPPSAPLARSAIRAARASNASMSAFLPPTSSNFPNGATSYFNVNGFGIPGVGRNSFRGPRFSSLDFSAAKNFGLPTLPFLGENARIELRANFYSALNKLNLAPFTFGSTSTTLSYGNASDGTPTPNPLFRTASTGLAGRVVELQARISF